MQTHNRMPQQRCIEARTMKEKARKLKPVLFNELRKNATVAVHDFDALANKAESAEDVKQLFLNGREQFKHGPRMHRNSFQSSPNNNTLPQ